MYEAGAAAANRRSDGPQGRAIADFGGDPNLGGGNFGVALAPTDGAGGSSLAMSVRPSSVPPQPDPAMKTITAPSKAKNAMHDRMPASPCSPSWARAIGSVIPTT